MKKLKKIYGWACTYGVANPMLRCWACSSKKFSTEKQAEKALNRHIRRVEETSLYSHYGHVYREWAK